MAPPDRQARAGDLVDGPTAPIGSGPPNRRVDQEVSMNDSISSMPGQAAPAPEPTSPAPDATKPRQRGVALEPMFALPSDVLRRYNAKVLDPSTAKQLKGQRPVRPTVYVADHLLVSPRTDPTT